MTLNVRFLYERNLLIFIILAVDRKISGIFNRPIIRSLNQRVPGSSPGASTKFPYFLLNEIDMVWDFATCPLSISTYVQADIVTYKLCGTMRRVQ